jgi:hypothetical protein
MCVNLIQKGTCRMALKPWANMSEVRLPPHSVTCKVTGWSQGDTHWLYAGSPGRRRCPTMDRN